MVYQGSHITPVPNSPNVLLESSAVYAVFVVCVCECVCWRETTCTPLSPCLLLSASESGTRRKRPIIKKPLSPSLFCGHKPLLCFFVFILSPSLAFWHSSSIPTVPETPTATRYSRSRTHASSLFRLMPTFSNFANDSSQSLKIAIMLPGPSSAPYLIIFERKAGWRCLLNCLLLW